MKKKVVVLGGGTGISFLLRGLKDFPIDITAIITVSDNGRSTGKLRQEFHIPAVGDIRKVITNLSGIDEPIKEMMSYRFKTSSDLDGHAVGNLILTAMLDITGSLKESIAHLSKLLDVKHTVLPISEDRDLTLMGEEPKVLPEAIEALKGADLIILSMGSLYTSALPNVICKEVQDTISKLDTPIMYLCNLFTQPGETDSFSVSDHIKMLNSYLEDRKVDVVIANKEKIDPKMAKKYETEEQKDPVLIDYEALEKMGVELIEDDLVIIDEDNTLKHNSLKLSSLIFSYLLRK